MEFDVEVESIAVSGLSKGPAPGAAALSARRALSLISASEAPESPSPCRRIGSSTRCQQNWPSISTTEGSGRAHLGYRQSYRPVPTRGGQWHRPSHLQLTPQLLAPCGPGWGQVLQSPALVAWRAAIFRRWEGRGRRRRFLYRCRRKQCRSLVRIPQVSQCCYKPNPALSHTSNSGPVDPIAICCCRRCWSRRAE